MIDADGGPPKNVFLERAALHARPGVMLADQPTGSWNLGQEPASIREVFRRQAFDLPCVVIEPDIAATRLGVRDVLDANPLEFVTVLDSIEDLGAYMHVAVPM